jgi:UDP-N-acetylglucosamine 2-epimerase (non-hydrolysing)
VISVVGARPQFVKLAPVARAFSASGVVHRIVHTGQHYDALMSDVHFRDLNIPTPDVSLGIGSGSQAKQTGAMMMALEEVFQDESPDWVLVYGDTNSTLAAALAAVKLHVRIAHLEAGLRSFNRRMPEEHNRVLTDHASDLLLAPTANAMIHLKNEGLQSRSVLVGDVMADVCLDVMKRVKDRDVTEVSGGVPSGQYLVATLHRADNTDDLPRLKDLIAALQNLPFIVVLPVHPRLSDRARSADITLKRGSLIPIEPLSYSEMILLVSQAFGVVTDSGGLQKEAFILGVPCTTLRTETEWVETLENGWNVLVPEPGHLAESVTRPFPSIGGSPHFGVGDAASAVVQVLRDSN